MSAKYYFLAMLFLPLILPISIFFIGENYVTGVLLLSMGFGGIPYIIFIGIILYWIRNRDVEYIRKLTYVAPLLFIPVQSLYMIIDFMVNKFSNQELTGLGGSILVSAVYIVILGYIYVLLVNVGYIILEKSKSLKLT